MVFFTHLINNEMLIYYYLIDNKTHYYNGMIIAYYKYMPGIEMMR